MVALSVQTEWENEAREIFSFITHILIYTPVHVYNRMCVCGYSREEIRIA